MGKKLGTYVVDEMVGRGEALRRPSSGGPDRAAAALAAASGFGALFAAAACCVLPLGFAALGLGASGLSRIVPLHWPLTIAAMLAVAVGWFLYLRRKRACALNSDCAVTERARGTALLLALATGFVVISAIWSFIEAPLTSLLGG